jgi:hypothetical protein
MGAENLAFTGIRTPDLPARSDSLYRLGYPGPHCQPASLFNDKTLPDTQTANKYRKKLKFNTQKEREREERKWFKL